jgi:hypothetical protein
VPVHILIAVVSEFRLYGFWRAEGLFAEFLRILENQGVTGLRCSARASDATLLTLPTRSYKPVVGRWLEEEMVGDKQLLGRAVAGQGSP